MYRILCPMDVPALFQQKFSDARGVPVRATVNLLRRYVFLESACIEALATWFLLTPAYEVKIRFGYELWAHTERVSDLRRRLGELRGGHHQANVEPALVQVGQTLRSADSPAAFYLGWRRLNEHFLDTCEAHLACCDASANAADRRLLDRLIADRRRSLAQTPTIESHLALDATATNWANQFEAMLQSAGDVAGYGKPSENSEPMPVQRSFSRPEALVFDGRISKGTFEQYGQRLERPVDERRIAEFEIFFNEFYAAALLATILVDAWQTNAPWAFYEDLAHHFWDEVRHAEFGMVRLRELGVQPKRVDLTLFEAAQGMPFLHRICYLTLGLEVFFMPRKRPRVRRYEEAGDARSQLFADVDWSDEGNHVQYGKRWVEYFLEEDARSIAELQDEIAEYMASTFGQLPEGQLAPY